MFAAMLIAQLTVIPTVPPLSPEEAVRVLRASGSIVDRSDGQYHPPGPTSFTVRSTAGDGPFGAFPEDWRLPPTNPTLTFRIPRRPGGLGGLVTSAGVGAYGNRASRYKVRDMKAGS